MRYTSNLHQHVRRHTESCASGSCVELGTLAIARAAVGTLGVRSADRERTTRPSRLESPPMRASTSDGGSRRKCSM